MRGPSSPHLIGDSAAFRALSADIEVGTQTDAPLMIEGETGVGKSLVASVVHGQSRRSSGPFVAFSAANLSESLFESELFGYRKGAFSGALEERVGLAQAAHQGTLFLDEIGELSLVNQAKMLRFLDDQRVRPVGGVHNVAVDTRVISATNQNLERCVEEGKFRRDLYFRLRVLNIRVPALRERPSDIPLLVDFFLDGCCQRYGKRLRGIQPAAIDRLEAYSWDGNVRELKHEIERLVATVPTGEAIQVRHLSPRIVAGAAHQSSPCRCTCGPLDRVRRQAERHLILQTICRHGWNVSATARELGLSRGGLSRKLAQLRIQRPGAPLAAGSGTASQGQVEL